MTSQFKYTIFAVMLATALSTSTILSQTTLPSPKQEKLLNGLKVLMWSDSKAEKVSVKIRIHSGSAFDPQGKEGLMQMLADNLFPNEAARDFFQEDLGGDLEIITNYDYFQVNASSKPESFLTMLEAVSSAVSNPAIDKETTAKLRTALMAKVATLEADPAYVADQAVAKRLFGTFPYGRPQYGTADSLKKIDFGDLNDARNRFLTADNATMAITGNFDKTTGFRAIRRYFGSWLKADKKIPSTFRQPDEPNTEQLSVLIPDFEGSFFQMAKTAPAFRDKGRYPFYVLGYLLSEADCLGYSRYDAYFLKGIIITQPKAASKALTDTNACTFLTRKTDGAEILQIDFDRAKSKMAAYFKTLTSSPASLADLWLDVDTYGTGLPDEELRKAMSVSLADVRVLVADLSVSPTVKVLVNPPKSN